MNPLIFFVSNISSVHSLMIIPELSLLNIYLLIFISLFFKIISQKWKCFIKKDSNFLFDGFFQTALEKQCTNLYSVNSVWTCQFLYILFTWYVTNLFICKLNKWGESCCYFYRIYKILNIFSMFIGHFYLFCWELLFYVLCTFFL